MNNLFQGENFNILWLWNFMNKNHWKIGEKIHLVSSYLNVYPRPAWHHRRTEEGWITYFKEKIFDILWLWNIIHKTKWLKNWKNQRKASHLNVYPRPAWHHRKTEEGWITYFKENILTFYDFGILWTKIIEKLEERSTSLIKIL